MFSNFVLPIFDSLAITSYLDPGTGSYALQLLLAGAFGGLFALKQSWQQLRGWLITHLPGQPDVSTPAEGAK